MKKLLGISLVAVLTATPLMAMAAPVGTGTTPARMDPQPEGSEAISAVTASGAPYYALVEANSTTDRNAATAGYVKGAYNAAIKAVNKVSETANNAADKNLSNLTTEGKAAVAASGTVDLTKQNYEAGTIGKALVEIKTTADGAVQSVTDGTATSGNGTILVDDQAVHVYGLGSSAYVNTGDLADTAGTYSNTASGLTATTIQDAIDELDTAIDGLDDTYATEAEVTTSINNATGSVTLNNDNALAVAGTPAGTISNEVTGGSVTIALMDDWSNPNTPGSGVTANVTGAGVTSTFTGTGITGGKATGTISNIDISAQS